MVSEFQSRFLDDRLESIQQHYVSVRVSQPHSQCNAAGFHLRSARPYGAWIGDAFRDVGCIVQHRDQQCVTARWRPFGRGSARRTTFHVESSGSTHRLHNDTMDRGHRNTFAGRRASVTRRFVNGRRRCAVGIRNGQDYYRRATAPVSPMHFQKVVRVDGFDRFRQRNLGVFTHCVGQEIPLCRSGQTKTNRQENPGGRPLRFQVDTLLLGSVVAVSALPACASAASKCT